MNETSKNMAAGEQHELTNSSIENLKEKFITESIALQDRLQEILKNLNEASLSIDNMEIQRALKLNVVDMVSTYIIIPKDTNDNLRLYLHNIRNGHLLFQGEVNYLNSLNYKEKCDNSELITMEKIERELVALDNLIKESEDFVKWAKLIRFKLE